MGDWDREPVGPPRHYDYPFYEYDHAQRVAVARRIAEEKAHYERGFPVAGHDFSQEAWERLKPRM